MEMDAAKLIGAGLAVIALAGVGVGIGNIFASLVTAVGRNPAAKNEVFGIAILGFALTEAVALFALVIALLLLLHGGPTDRLRKYTSGNGLPQRGILRTNLS